MLKQKFRVGDLVHHPVSKEIVRVQAAIFARNSAEFSAEITYTSSKTTTKVKKFGKQSETWMYNLGGAAARHEIHSVATCQELFAQEALTSATPCPSCEYPSWDWASGCVMCGLSPEDGE
jgi:hypothetical protein